MSIRLMFLLLTICSAPALAQESMNAMPGIYFHGKAKADYEAGRFEKARERFEMSARWADKLSQFNLGVMYYHGQGVPVDRARAWAWFKLSAERRYPTFMRMAGQVEAELGPDEFARAQAIYAELAAKFGDAVTIPRAERRMRRELRSAAGSRTGFIGAVTVIDGRGTHPGGRYFKRENWDFAAVLEREARQFEALERTRVELREMRVKEPREVEGDARD